MRVPRILRVGLTLALAGFVPFALAGAKVALPLGGSLPVTMQGNSFSNDVFIDVPEGTQRLVVRLLAANPAQDIDLLVRYDSAFPDLTIDGGAPDSSWLFDHAQYLAASVAGDERVTLTRFGRFPIRAGRLHLSLINFEPGTVNATLSAVTAAADEIVPITMVFDDPGSGEDTCNVSGWTDSRAATPVRGNSGTTLGAQRRNAAQEAARLLSEQIRPAVPVRVRACWDELESGALAQAGPRGFSIGGTFAVSNGTALRVFQRALPRAQTFYSRAATAQRVGTPSCGFGGSCDQHDVSITFNFAPDNQSQANRRFDYGFDREGSTGASFVSVAMHEISHGLGFAGLIDRGTGDGELGAKLTPFDDIYGSLAVIRGSSEPIPFLRATIEQRQAALTQGDQLRFSGARASVSSENFFNGFAFPDNLPRLHTPQTVAGGSTYSHLSIEHFNQLMLAAISATAPRTLGLAGPMLEDLGWDRDAVVAAPEFPVAEGQYFDPLRDGHGFDFRRVAGTTDLYFLVFYTFDAQGNPEWFNSVGRVVDGYFLPARNEFGDSLLQNLFRPGQNPQTVVDADPAFNGQVRLGFDGAVNAPSCQLSLANNLPSGREGVLSWILNAGNDDWCSLPLTPADNPVAVDYSGIWFNPADPGWGITFLSFPGEGGDGLAAQIYYPDASGRGRWAFMQATSYSAGGTYPVFQVSNGYCRDCEAPTELEVVQIGEITVNLQPGGSGSTVSFRLTYPGAEGGVFERSAAPISPGSEPGF